MRDVLGAAVVQLEGVHLISRQTGAHICPWLVLFGTSFTSFAGSNGGSETRAANSARILWKLIWVLCSTCAASYLCAGWSVSSSGSDLLVRSNIFGSPCNDDVCTNPTSQERPAPWCQGGKEDLVTCR